MFGRNIVDFMDSEFNSFGFVPFSVFQPYFYLSFLSCISKNLDRIFLFDKLLKFSDSLKWITNYREGSVD